MSRKCWQCLGAKTRTCKGPCKCIKAEHAFCIEEWNNKRNPHCKDCKRKLKQQGKTQRCSRCMNWFIESELHISASSWNTIPKLVCTECKQGNTQTCFRCRKRCSRSRNANPMFVCKKYNLFRKNTEYVQCRHRTIGMWTCMNKHCKMQKPIEEFSMARAKHGNICKGNNRRCNDCSILKQNRAKEQLEQFKNK